MLLDSSLDVVFRYQTALVIGSGVENKRPCSGRELLQLLTSLGNQKSCTPHLGQIQGAIHTQLIPQLLLPVSKLEPTMGRVLQKKKNRSSLPKVKQKPKSKHLNIKSNPIVAANW